MNLQTILDNRKQREAIDDRLQNIYSDILDAEVEFASKLTKKELETYQRIFREQNRGDRKFGKLALGDGMYSNKFYLNTDDDALTITDDGIKAAGYTDTQSGRFDDPIFIPAALFESYGTSEWQAALDGYMATRFEVFATTIANEERAAKRAKAASVKKRQRNDRATYERLRTQFEGGAGDAQ